EALRFRFRVRFGNRLLHNGNHVGIGEWFLCSIRYLRWLEGCPGNCGSRRLALQAKDEDERGGQRHHTAACEQKNPLGLRLMAASAREEKWRLIIRPEPQLL